MAACAAAERAVELAPEAADLLPTPARLASSRRAEGLAGGDRRGARASLARALELDPALLPMIERDAALTGLGGPPLF